jgi:hypothetical protein
MEDYPSSPVRSCLFNIVTCCLVMWLITRGRWFNTAFYLAFPWPSYKHSLYWSVTHKQESCLLVLLRSSRRNFWTILSAGLSLLLAVSSLNWSFSVLPNWSWTVSALLNWNWTVFGTQMELSSVTSSRTECRSRSRTVYLLLRLFVAQERAYRTVI